MRNLRRHSKVIGIACVIIYFLYENFGNDSKSNNSKISCGKYPAKKDIKFDNFVWQVLTTPLEQYRLLNAYYDDRENKKIVRVSMLAQKLSMIYCQFWFDETSDEVPIVVEATQFIKFWPEEYGSAEGLKLPYLVTCPIEFKNRLPSAVSLTAKGCDYAENRLKIIDNQPIGGMKKSFGVCSKHSATTSERSHVIRFIEWVHVMKLLGADKITIYHRDLPDLHPDLNFMLNFFHEKDIVDFYEFKEPSNLINDFTQWLILQVMMVTDCFYRTRNLYKYHLLLDTDEVILPRKETDFTWHDLIKNFDFHQGYVSFLSERRTILKINPPSLIDIPDYHYMLTHTIAENDIQNTVKPIFLPDKPFSIYTLFPMYCFDGDKVDTMCHWYRPVPHDIALLYQFTNEDKGATENNTIADTTIWKIKQELIQEVQKTLTETGFKP